MRKLLTVVAAALAMAACCGKTGGTQGKQNGMQAITAEQNETEMIRLNVFVTVAPEHIDEVVAGLNTLAAASRAEDGCEGYEIFQSTIAPSELIIVETWRGQAALDAHGKTPHYTTILPPLSDKMQLKLERFEY